MQNRLGVLALQGDFREHIAVFAQLGVAAIEVRTAAELAQCGALVLPGGESTAQGLIAQRCGLLAPLAAFVSSGRPVWGTCAGLVLLADRLGLPPATLSSHTYP
jgi:5'-phosphate synthase pdxT subunit